MKNIFRKIIIWKLEFLARLVLKKYKPKIVSITGSVGKTSTKDAVYAVLSTKYFVRKSEKSFNSEIGVPLTILGIPNAWNDPLIWARNILKSVWLIVWPHEYPQWLVIEAGVGKPGDMARFAKYLYSDAFIFTAFSKTPVHVEFFSDRYAVLNEKAILFTTIRKNGFAILNADDEDVMSFKNEVEDKYKKEVFTFGFSENADLVARNDMLAYESRFPTGVSCVIDDHKKEYNLKLDGVFGHNHIYAALAALALANKLDIPSIDAVKALENYDTPPGRMKPVAGMNSTMILDDTYNASPIGVETGLELLERLNSAGKKIAVLGDMLELGKYTEEAHKNVGTKAKDSCDILVAVGKRSQATVEGAKYAGMPESAIFYFDTSVHAGEFLKTIIQKGDIILVKGSQGVRMERAIEIIMADPEDKESLLVRQEKEWKEKK